METDTEDITSLLEEIIIPCEVIETWKENKFCENEAKYWVRWYCPECGPRTTLNCTFHTERTKKTGKMICKICVDYMNYITSGEI